MDSVNFDSLSSPDRYKDLKEKLKSAMKELDAGLAFCRSIGAGYITYVIFIGRKFGSLAYDCLHGKDVKFDPNWRIHPSEIVLDLFSDFKIDRSEFCRRSGVDLVYINDFLDGKEPMTEGISIALNREIKEVDGVNFWMDLQELYDTDWGRKWQR